MASMTTQGDVIHVAIELSQSSWLVAARLPDAKKSHLFRIAGGEASALLKLLSSLRMRFAAKTRRPAKIICCFEAGRDGFWLHRLLIGHAIESYVLEPTSILVNRRARRAKTDRLDAEGMLRVLATYLAGDHKACSMVRVPTPDEEDAKRPHRERQHLTRERLRIENRIEALLFTQGVRERPSLRSWERDVAGLRTGDGRAIPHRLRAELDRLRRQLVLILSLIREVDAERAWPARGSPRSRSTARSLRCAASEASAIISQRCSHARSSTAHLLTAVSLPATWVSLRCPIRAATSTAIVALAAPATHAPEQR